MTNEMLCVNRYNLDELGVNEETLKALKSQLVQRGAGRPQTTFIELIQEAIKDFGGYASLNEIVVGLFRKTGRVYGRSRISGRVKRLADFGFVTKENNNGVIIYRLNAAAIDGEAQDGGLPE